MTDKPKIHYICAYDRCPYKLYVNNEIWVCPFKGCMFKTQSGRQPWRIVKEGGINNA